jgi:hypothetical protein
MAKKIPHDTTHDNLSFASLLLATNEPSRSARVDLHVLAPAQRLHGEMIKDPHCVFARWLGQFRDAAERHRHAITDALRAALRPISRMCLSFLALIHRHGHKPNNTLTLGPIPKLRMSIRLKR